MQKETEEVRKALFRLEEIILRVTDILERLYENDQIILELLKRQD